MTFFNKSTENKGKTCLVQTRNPTSLKNQNSVQLNLEFVLLALLLLPDAVQAHPIKIDVKISPLVIGVVAGISTIGLYCLCLCLICCCRNRRNQRSSDRLELNVQYPSLDNYGSISDRNSRLDRSASEENLFRTKEVRYQTPHTTQGPSTF